MSDLKDILKGSLARLGVAKQVEAAGVVEKATAEIAKYIPKEDFEVVSFKNGVLKVKTRSSVVAAQLGLYKNRLLKEEIKELRIVT